MTSKKGLKHEQILGINISSTQSIKVLSSIRSALVKRRGVFNPGVAKFIVTPNPEIVNASFKDKNFRKILNSADYSIADGVGLVAADRFLKLKAPKFIPFRFFYLLLGGFRVGYSILFDKKWLYRDIRPIKGREFFMDLIKLANKKGWRVYLLGGGGVAIDLKDILKRSFKKVHIKADEGPLLTSDGNPVSKVESEKEKLTIEKINKTMPHLLFVAFGAPKQEKWVNRWRENLKVGAVMTVGGTFNYLSGKKKMPPSWMERLGIEWLWRMITEPTFKRIKRVLTAFPLFPLKVFWYKLTHR